MEVTLYTNSIKQKKWKNTDRCLYHTPWLFPKSSKDDLLTHFGLNPVYLTSLCSTDVFRDHVNIFSHHFLLLTPSEEFLFCFWIILHSSTFLNSVVLPRHPLLTYVLHPPVKRLEKSFSHCTLKGYFHNKSN